MRGIVFVAALAAALSVPRLAAAYGYCTEPQEPICLTIWSDSSFDFCRLEVQQYLRALDAWVACISDDASDKAKKVVDRFNCHARGDSFCL